MFDLRYAIPQQPDPGTYGLGVLSTEDLCDERRYMEIEANLKREIVSYEKDQALALTEDSVLLWPGLRNALYTFFVSCLTSEEELLIPLPAWSGVLELCSALGVRAVMIPADASGRPDYQSIPDYVTEKTRAIYVGEPNNPCGALLEPADWTCLKETLMRYPQLLLVIDGAYQGYEWVAGLSGARAENFAQLSHQLVYMNTCSKQLGMPYVRVAYVVAPPQIRRRLRKSQELFGCYCSSVSLLVVHEAMTHWPSHRRNLRRIYQRNCAVLSACLTDLFGPGTVSPMGGLYCFPQLTDSQVARFGRGDRALASRRMAEWFYKIDVWVLDGSLFGAPGHLRLSYGTAEEYLAGAISRLRESSWETAHE